MFKRAYWLFAYLDRMVVAASFLMSFLAFIPFEEHQLVKARGDEYRTYMARTPYRVFQGIW